MKTETKVGIFFWVVVLFAVVVGGVLISQTSYEPFNLTESEPDDYGQPCSHYAYPGAVIVNETGSILRCDPDSDKWVFVPIQTDRIDIRLPGVCGAGSDVGTACAADADCDGSCTIAGDQGLINFYRLGSDKNDADLMAQLLRFNPTDDTLSPYPGPGGSALGYHDLDGVSGANTNECLSIWGSKNATSWPLACPSGGCRAMEVCGNWVWYNPDQDFTNFLVYATDSSFSIDGTGSGSAKTVGSFTGYIKYIGGGTSGQIVWLADANPSSTIGKIFSDGQGKMSVQWWDGSAEDLALQRTAADTLELEGGNLIPKSPSIVASTRVLLPFGNQLVSDADIANGVILDFASWGSVRNPLDIEGYPMPRDGSITGLSAFCHIDSCCGTNGTIDLDVYDADGNDDTDPDNATLRFTATSASISAAGEYTWQATQARGTDTFSAGDAFFLALETSASGGIDVNGNSHCMAMLEVVFDD